MAGIWQRGRRLFTVASILMLLTAAFHTLVQFSPPGDAGETALISTMQSYHIDLGLGMRPSFFTIFRTQAFTMTITFAALAMINLVLAGSVDLSDRLLRRIVWLNAAWVAVFTAMSFGYRVLPPLISGLLILVVLLAALVLNRKA